MKKQPDPKIEAVETEAPFAALPTLSPEQILENKLAEALATVKKQKGELQDVREHRNHLHEKLSALETNALTFALSNLDAGSVLEDAGKTLSDLVVLVGKRQEKGDFVLKLTIKPFKGALVVESAINTKEPKVDAPQSIFYANDAGKLSRNDPRQKEFGFSRPDRSSADDELEKAEPELR